MSGKVVLCSNYFDIIALVLVFCSNSCSSYIYIYLWRGKPRSRHRAGQEAATKAGGTDNLNERTKNSAVCPSVRVVSYRRCVYCLRLAVGVPCEEEFF